MIILENVLFIKQMSEGEVLEGFLCPLCMKDLGDVIQLQVRLICRIMIKIIIQLFTVAL